MLGQRAGDRDTLLLAARKRVGALPRLVGEVEPFQRMERDLAIPTRKHEQAAEQTRPVPESPRQHIVHHGEPVDQIELLEDESDPAAQPSPFAARTRWRCPHRLRRLSRLSP